MNNKKIGKLIATLRNQKGLTQQELGDKVGVGFRAVSKWETGASLPDIAIINEISEILGITSDELLKGELNKERTTKETKNKISPKLKITITIITAIIFVLATVLVYTNNTVYAYKLASAQENETYVEGQITFKGKNVSIVINKLNFFDQTITNKVIKNYEYQIFAGDEFIYGFGYGLRGEILEGKNTIQDIANQFEINFNDQIFTSRRNVITEGIVLRIIFIEPDNNKIEKEIKLILSLTKN